MLIVRIKGHCRTQALAHNLKPKTPDLVRRQFALDPRGMEPGLKPVESDLAHHRIEAILNPPHQKHAAFLWVGISKKLFKDETLTKDRGGLGQGQGRVGQQGPARCS